MDASWTIILPFLLLNLILVVVALVDLFRRDTFPCAGRNEVAMGIGYFTYYNFWSNYLPGCRS